MQIFETENSRYEVDLINLRYRRSTLAHATPDQEGGRLTYGDWHKLKDVPDAVRLIPEPGQEFKAPEVRHHRLRILEETSKHGIITSRITRIEVQ